MGGGGGAARMPCLQQLADFLISADASFLLPRGCCGKGRPEAIIELIELGVSYKRLEPATATLQCPRPPKAAHKATEAKDLTTSLNTHSTGTELIPKHELNDWRENHKGFAWNCVEAPPLHV